MHRVSTGIDIVEVPRVQELLERQGDAFLARCFTPGEIEYSRQNPRRFVEHIAARFAAKEAVLKALGTGWGAGVGWTDVEVVSTPTGRPELRLHNAAAEIARSLGLTTWSISLTHTESVAAASVVAIG